MKKTRSRSSQRGPRYPYRVRVACDSMVALPPVAAPGAVLFAKNSDRPAQECQRLVQMARQEHPAGARVRCQYVEIPQVRMTARLIGSQPFWLWGFEHGLNEHGVAIGNHTVFTRDTLGPPGLIGMDLVRLALERATTARDAVGIITALAEQYGQGGSGYVDKDWPYHNSFLVADRGEAYLIETSDRRWAVRQIRDCGSATNHLTIRDDWDELGPDVVQHAAENGWWSSADGARFDFAAAYRDTSVAPPVISSGRHRRTCTLLDQHRGHITPATLISALRDHYGGLPFQADTTPEDERYFSVCMHADPVGTTTASMVARLPAEPDELLCYWGSLGSPCLGIFLPYYIEGEIPAAVACGGAQPSHDSPWWQFKQLLTLVERDFRRYAPDVRTYWDEFEEAILARSREVELHAITLLKDGNPTDGAALLTRLMTENVEETLERLQGLLDYLQTL